MDLRRLAIFLLLSWAIVFTWSTFFAPPLPAPAPAAAEGDPSTTPVAGAALEGSASGATDGPGVGASGARDEFAWSETLELGTPGQPGHYQATFSSEGATLAALRLPGYYDSGQLTEAETADPEHWVALVEPVPTGEGIERSLSLVAGPSAQALVSYPLEDVHWEHEILEADGRAVGVRFRHQPKVGGVTFEKTIRTVPGRYELEVELGLVGGTEAPPTTNAGFLLRPAVGVPLSSEDTYYIEPKARACGRDQSGSEPRLESTERDDRGRERSGSFGVGELLSAVGVDNKYFAMLLHPVEGEAGELSQGALREASWYRLPDRDYAVQNPDVGLDIWRHVVAQVELTLRIPQPGERSAYQYRLFAGPKETDVLGEHHGDFQQLVDEDLGFFDGIAAMLLKVLGFFHGLVGNWGVAIILLTLTVRMVLFPINRRSQTAMARHATKMKRVQPKLNDLKEKYKKDPRKQREMQAKIMQEEGAFPPLGGCLPMFLQIPVFFGLFSALRVSFDLRQAEFLWVKDLSMPDRVSRLFSEGAKLPLVGSIEWLNILPPLMVVLWIVQQRVMPKPTDEQALKMHKMMMWMPIIFGVFLYNYSAGLSLYMITTSLFGILEYTVIRKIWPIDDSEQAKKEPGKLAKRWSEAVERVQEEQRRQQREGGGGKGKGKGGGNGGGKGKRK